MMASGVPVAEVARRLGIPPATLFRWRSGLIHTDLDPPFACFVCRRSTLTRRDAGAYAYLLGQYLGDGHLVTSARVPVLGISVCTDYPSICAEVMQAVQRVRGRPPGTVSASNSERLENVQSYWNHWPCLFPQHGPGRKHERPIILEQWQRDLVADHPWELLRGLIHSDGCRSLNTIWRGSKSYAYPRYFFSNESTDIIGVFSGALDQVGVRWRMCRPNLVAVSRRADVALMDDHIGPKR